MGIKERRKALGWSRAELAQRTGLNSPVIAMIERGDWSEDDAHTRVHHVLGEAERGNTDVVLAPPKPDGDPSLGG